MLNKFETFNRKLIPIKERRPWSLLEKNPVSAELMHIYLNTFPWPTTLCFNGYRNVTHSKVTGNFVVNALHAFHRFNRRYNVKKYDFCFKNLLFVKKRNECRLRIFHTYKVCKLSNETDFLFTKVFIVNVITSIKSMESMECIY